MLESEQKLPNATQYLFHFLVFGKKTFLLSETLELEPYIASDITLFTTL